MLKKNYALRRALEDAQEHVWLMEPLYNKMDVALGNFDKRVNAPDNQYIFWCNLRKEEDGIRYEVQNTPPANRQGGYIVTIVQRSID